MLKVLLLVASFSYLFSSTATDICKKNFDDEITKQTQMKKNLSELSGYCSSKQSEIKNAYKKVGDYKEKILNITKHNLIKSTLKLGYDVYQELSPLTGVEGNLVEIGEWIKSKMDDYLKDQAKDALGIKPKDYYDMDLKILSDDLSKLTPEVAKLNKMRTASLDAFKAKVMQETNQTVGDVGALYAKLRSLAKQSTIAENSLLVFYRKIENIINTSQSKIAQIDNIIEAYKSAKDRTCREYNQTVEPDPIVILPNVDKYKYTVSGEPKSCTNEEKENIRQQLNTLISEQNKLYYDLYSKFDEDFSKFDQELWDKQKEDKKNTIDTIGYVDGLLEKNGVLMCSLPGNIEVAYEKTMEYNTEFTRKEEEYVKDLKKLLDNYDSFYSGVKTKYADFFSKMLTKEKKIKKLALTCDGVVVENPYETANMMLVYMHGTILDKKKPFFKLYEDEKKISDAFKNSSSDIEKLMEEARKCVKRDQNDINIILPQVRTLINDLDEKDLAVKNILNYLSNLKEKGIVNATFDYEPGIKTLYAQYYINKSENSFFSKLYNDFPGDEIDYMNRLNEILRPINADVSNLKFFIDEKDLLISSDNNILKTMGAYGILTRSSAPLKNLTEANVLKNLFDEVHSKEMKQVYIYEDIVKFSDDIISGKIPYLTYPVPFKKVFDGIMNRWGQLRHQLEIPYWTANADNLSWYKEILNGVINFNYRLENTIDVYSLNLDFIQKIVDGNITYLKTVANQELPSSQAKVYDLRTNDLSCRDSLITLLPNKHSLTIFDKTLASVNVVYKSCDDRNITLEADLNQSVDDIKITKNNNNITLQASGSYHGDLNLIIKVYDDYGNKNIKILPVHVISESKSIFLKKGWNLISGGFDTSSLNNDILIVWSYIDGVWYANSPNKTIYDILQKVAIPNNIKNLDFISQKRGIWVYAKKDTELKLDAFTTDKINIDNAGWSMIGNTIMINSPTEISCKDGVLDILWQYLTDDGWKVYYKDHINEIQLIEPNSGFWVHCSKDYK